jgi:hypothetical protein
MRKDDIVINSILDTGPLRRWPDKRLNLFFKEIFDVYKNLLNKCPPQERNDPKRDICKCYKKVCNWIVESFHIRDDIVKNRSKSYSEEQITIYSMMKLLRGIYKNEYLQAVASLLGMLMHFSFKDDELKVLRNQRRPRKLFTTYPNSPYVSRILGDKIVTDLLEVPIPLICHRYIDAEYYAEKSLNFRILDPSAESGQLLLEVALALIRKVQSRHLNQSKACKYLVIAMLKKLCQHCLWCIDRNILSKYAVATVFNLLGQNYSIERIEPGHFIITDALEYYLKGKLGYFDGIINNPPWGEKLTPVQRNRLKKTFNTLEYQADTYIAFTELILKSLRPGGVFGLLLPSQIVATKNSGKLRMLITSLASIEQMILLPRAAFANASVRGFLLTGRIKPQNATENCNITIYPLERGLISPNAELTRSYIIPNDVFRKAGVQPWWSIFNSNNNQPGSQKKNMETVQLRKVADVIMGIKLYAKGKGSPPQTADVVLNKPFTFTQPSHDTLPAVNGRDIQKNYVKKPRIFVKFGKWLAYRGKHLSLLGSERIFIREICSRNGNLNAAIVSNGYLPLHGVLTVIPRLIDIHILTAFLNSSKAAEYVSTHTSSFSKVDFQKITLSELREMPIPIDLLDSESRSILSLRPQNKFEFDLYEELKELAKEMSNSAQKKNLLEGDFYLKIDTIISKMYNKGE